MIRFIQAIFVLALLTANCYATTSVSVMDFGASETGKFVAEKVRAQLRTSGEFLVADADLTRSAAMGIGYAGSLNLSTDEARDLGAALASDFYVLGEARVQRRSSFEKPVYFEAYCTVFIVNSRTGRLLSWWRPSFNDDEPRKAYALLLQNLADLSYSLKITMRRANEDERL